AAGHPRGALPAERPGEPARSRRPHRGSPPRPSRPGRRRLPAPDSAAARPPGRSDPAPPGRFPPPLRAPRRRRATAAPRARQARLAPARAPGRRDGGMKRALLGVVDIGSNTIRSLIVEAHADGAFRTLDDEREVARLAAGLNRQGRLSPAAVRRAVTALKRMAEIMRARGVEPTSVVATSGIRNAANRRTFLER